MDTDEISYKNLRKIQQLEKTSPFLSKVNKNFYGDLSNYIKKLEEVVKQEKKSENLNIFQEEIKNTKKIAFNIYELREKKIVQSALSKVRGAKPDLKNILEIEKRLFESLVELINQSRKNILNEKQKEEGKEDYQKKESKSTIQNDNQIVRVLENIPEFIGTNMKTFHLRKEDVLSVAKEISGPLIKRNVVEVIK